MMRPFATVIALLFVAATHAADPSTVGDMTQSHDSGKWLRRVIVRTPSILPGMPPTTFDGDALRAIQSYDRVIGLTDDPAVRNEAMRRSAYLRVRSAEADPGHSSTEDLRRAVALYQRVLAEAPGDPANDRAHYQLARAHELLGESGEASRMLAKLAAAHPASALASDAHFRAAELLYLAKDYAAAEAEYRSVVDGGPAPHRQFAVYKYGWSLYHQGKYEEALAPFLSILDAELPAGTDLAKDVVGVVSMAFASMGEGAIARYFARGSEPPYVKTLYLAVGDLQEKLQRYSDAASTYASFASRPGDPVVAAQFQSRVIEAYARGGFAEKVVEAKKAYVSRFGFGAEAWKSGAPPPQISAALREHLAGLAQHHHSLGQAAQAADAYQRLLAWFPADAGAAELSLLYADALHDAGRLGESAQQYLRAAYDYPRSARSGEAALAAVQAYRDLAQRASGADRAGALRASIAASLKLADAFAQHASWTTVVAQSAIDQVELVAWDDAIALATRVLDSGKPIPNDLRVRMLGVVADGEFAQGRFARAEAAYAAMATPAAAERLAESIYRQAEAARAAGDLRLAAQTFERVGQVAPGASIRATADYDAAAAWMAVQDWKAARLRLEEFRARNAGHALVAQADRKLALAYQNDRLPLKAAEAYARIARRDSESTQVRAEAAFLAAQLYDQSGATLQGMQAYEYYLVTFAPPVERRVEVLQRLADIALQDRGDKLAYQRALREIVTADAGAGSQRTPQTRLLAARATLEIGRLQAQAARQVALRQPLTRSLAQRRAATESAIATLLSAADYHFAEITPAASYEIGRLYADLADALVRSERPRSLQGLAREQYDVLLEEQSEPFAQKAISAHEANLQRLRDNVWNDAIRGSAGELSALVPGRYGKRESNEVSYDALR